MTKPHAQESLVAHDQPQTLLGCSASQKACAGGLFRLLRSKASSGSVRAMLGVLVVLFGGALGITFAIAQSAHSSIADLRVKDERLEGEQTKLATVLSRVETALSRQSDVLDALRQQLTHGRQPGGKEGAQ